MPKGVKGSGPRARSTGLVPKEWKPSAAQEKALSFTVSEPSLASNSTALAEAIGMTEAAVRQWKRDPRFRTWWNTALLEVSREQIGPCVQELQRLVYDDAVDENGRPLVSASAKAKLVDTIIKATGQSKQGDMGTAVLAILERWNPSYGRTRIAATRAGIMAEIQGTRELAGMEMNASESLPQRSIDEISRVAQAEANALVRTVVVSEGDPATTARRYSSAPRLPPTLALGDGGPKSQTLDRKVDGPRTSSDDQTQGSPKPRTSSDDQTPDPASAAPAPHPSPPRGHPPPLRARVFGRAVQAVWFRGEHIEPVVQGPYASGRQCEGP